MRLLSALLVMFASGTPVLAHPGHLAEVTGHGHWLGAAALGAAIALGAWAALKGKKKDAETEAEDAGEELEEANA